MPRLGIITDELRNNTERAFDLAEKLHLKEVEIHTAWDKSVEELSDNEVKSLKDLLHHHNLNLCCLSSTVFLRCHLDDLVELIPPIKGFRTISGNYEYHMEALERCLWITSELEAPILRIFGFWRSGPTIEATYQKAMDRICPAVQLAEKNGIPLVLENCPHTFFDRSQRAVILLDKINSPWMNMLWDPGNSVLSNELDYLSSYKSIRHRLAHVHIKDIRIDPESLKGFCYVPIGKGMVDWHQILFKLKHDSYQGVTCLEPHHLGADGTLETAAKSSLEGLLRIINQMPNYL